MTFPALIAAERHGRITGQVESIDLARLPAGDVTIEVEYSSLNFKDALAATGQNKIARTYPHVPGIDAAGLVVESTSPAWKPGDRVLVNGNDFGAGQWGGYARYARVPADWVVRLPDSLSTFDAMAIGCAGYTAAMSLEAMERNGLTPSKGPVLVTGATGGVGCVAVDLFSAAGYEVAASTGKPEHHAWLRELGATQFLTREEVSLTDPDPKPMLRTQWAGAVDNVCGPTLDYLLRTTHPYGSIALCGLVGGTTFRGTVMPFILRGINLLGIDSGHVTIAERQALWDRLATSLRPPRLAHVARRIKLQDLPDAIDEMLQGRALGRLVVSLAP